MPDPDPGPDPELDPLVVTAPDGRTLAASGLGPRDGFPVLWCHGGLSSRLDAVLALDALATTGVRLVSVDRPGIGESTRQRGRTAADWPADAVAVADALGWERFAVAGWSAGGPFALACAALLPDRVTAVATIGGMAPLESRADRRELGLPVDRILLPLAHRARWLASLVLVPSRRMDAAAWKRATLRSVPAVDREALEPLPPEIAAGGSAAALRHGTHGTVDDYRAFGGDWGFDLGAVTRPVRCWQGDGDTLVPRAHAHRLADALPTGTLHVVPDAGHFLAVRHAAEVFRGLMEDAAT